MERDDIIKSAAESGWVWENLTNDQKDCILYFAQLVSKHVAEAAAASEREACIELTDSRCQCAWLIMARGKQT